MRAKIRTHHHSYRQRRPLRLVSYRLTRCRPTSSSSSGYNQIPMAATDMNKTAFISDDANYFYKVMPFGLKNAGATYQRLMDKVFNHLMGKCVEVYVDDMVIKSPNHIQHAQDLTTVFSALRQYNLRLNPEKCVFGVDRGKFIGFMLTQRALKQILKNATPSSQCATPTMSKKSST